MIRCVTRFRHYYASAVCCVFSLSASISVTPSSSSSSSSPSSALPWIEAAGTVIAGPLPRHIPVCDPIPETLWLSTRGVIGSHRRGRAAVSASSGGRMGSVPSSPRQQQEGELATQASPH
ncbi:hypothetical protein FKM82_027967 [Ascaphus truei]